MKLRIIIIKCLLLLVVNSCLQAQTVVNDSLVKLELDYFTNTNDSAKQKILLRKVNYLLKQNSYNEKTLSEFKRIHFNLLPNDSLKCQLFWNASLVAYLNRDLNFARYTLSEYFIQSRDSSVSLHFLNFLIHKNYDSSIVNHSLQKLCETDTLFKELICFKNQDNYSRKHGPLYIVASAVVPGLGTIANGELVKGLVSLGLSAAGAYGIYALVDAGLYANAILWGSGVGLKFYFGNLKLTEKTFYEKETKTINRLSANCEGKLHVLLEKYPLTLK